MASGKAVSFHATPNDGAAVLPAEFDKATGQTRLGEPVSFSFDGLPTWPIVHAFVASLQAMLIERPPSRKDDMSQFYLCAQIIRGLVETSLRPAKVRELAQLQPRHCENYLKSLGSAHARKMKRTRLMALLKRIGAKALPTPMVDWLNIRQIAGAAIRLTPTPRPSYDARVAAALAAECRKRIDQVETRLLRDRKVRIEEASDPREEGYKFRIRSPWRHEKRLIWEVAQTGPLSCAEWERRSGLRNAPTLVSDVNRMMFPTSEDLLPYYVILQLEIGMTPAECLELMRDCIHNVRRGFGTLVTRKDRAGRDIARSIRLSGRWSPGGIIRSLVEVTGLLRDVLPDGDPRSKYAFLMLDNKEARIRPLWINKQRFKDWTAALCRSLKLKDKKGLRVKSIAAARLRKTYKEREYRSLGGRLEGMTGDHSADVAFRHYANIPSLRPLHDETVSLAIRDACKEGLAVRTLTQREEASLKRGSGASVAKRLGLPKERARRLARGEATAFLNKCADPLDSPFSPKGKVCAVATWGCPMCPNSVWTEERLPRVIAYVLRLEDQATMLNPLDWMENHGAQYGYLTGQVIPRFSKAAVNRALKIAQSHGAEWYVPRHVRVVS